MSESTNWKGSMSRSEYMASQNIWKGAIVARDEQYSGGIGRVMSEPGDDGIAWVYWGTGDHGKYETREVVGELVRLDTNEDFMANYKRSEEG